jgi:hypothetical protein
MTAIGYARVSTDGQTLQAQTEALHGAGCARIFAEKISGAHSDRPQLAKAIAAQGEGDTLVVCKLDRLARSTRDLLKHVRCDWRGWRNIQVTSRYVGQYRHSTRSPNAHCVRRTCGVRTSPDPVEDSRG